MIAANFATEAFTTAQLPLDVNKDHFDHTKMDLFISFASKFALLSSSTEFFIRRPTHSDNRLNWRFDLNQVVIHLSSKCMRNKSK